MNTQYSAYAQSGSSGQQTSNNGIQGQPVYTSQQPNHNNFLPAMPIARGAFHNQRPLPYGQPDFAVQQLIDGVNHNMTFRHGQGTPTQFTHGNAHPVHTGPSVQPGFFGHQMFDLNGDEVAMAVAADPNAMAGFFRLRNKILQQRAQRRNTLTHREVEDHQTYQVQQHQQDQRNYNGGVEFNYIPTPTGSAVSSGADLPVTDVTRQATENTTPSGNRTTFSVGQPNQPTAMSPEVTDNFQELVNGLVADRGTAFGGHIRSDADVGRFEKAIWMAKSKGAKLQNKCADFPKNETERSDIIRRIFDAIVNTQGDQDLASDAAENGDCLAVRVIKGMSPLEVEILAAKLMVSTSRAIKS